MIVGVKLVPLIGREDGIAVLLRATGAVCFESADEE